MGSRRKSPLDELKKLKADVKSLRAQVVSESVRAEKWQKYAWDVRDKLNVAVERLRLISIESYYPSEATASDCSSTRQQKTAAHGLAKIAVMRERTMP